MAYGIANRRGQAPREEVASMLALCRQAEVRVLDTARTYGDSEMILGEQLDPAEDWEVATKLDPTVHEAGDREAVAAAARASLAASRRALRRERLDIVLLHRPVQRTAAGGVAWDVLRRDRASGRIGAIGISAITPADAIDALDVPDIEVIQVAASIFDRRLAEARFFATAAERGRRVFVRSVFLQGAGLLGTDDLPAYLTPLRHALATIDSLSGARDFRRQICLAYVRDRLPQATSVIGCETAAQLQANLAAWEAARIPTAMMDTVEAGVGVLPADVLDPWRWPVRRSESVASVGGT
jgi:aryl-alcohol dehydrogenase-like predicted oxidoreductase